MVVLRNYVNMSGEEDLLLELYVVYVLFLCDGCVFVIVDRRSD